MNAGQGRGVFFGGKSVPAYPVKLLLRLFLYAREKYHSLNKGAQLGSYRVTARSKKNATDKSSQLI